MDPSGLTKFEIEALLGRRAVQLEAQSISALLRGQVVMVTGAGGSIGSELCRQIASFQPERLLLIEQSELQLIQIEEELIKGGFGAMAVPLIGDITDEARMRSVLSRFTPGILFHAAAHKHVPMMENQPGEAIKNNAFGTALLAELSVVYGLDRFVLISSDKAINPTSVMGATKRLAEIYVQALSASVGHKTKFMAVRFGNVLGSSGSVVPIFKRQIAMGGPVTVTDPEVTRYFMTVSESAGLVLQAATQGTGGEIFVLDMGEPLKVLDLARQLIRLSGFEPDKEIKIEMIGLRPGEKLFEELSHEGENIAHTSHRKIVRFLSEPQDVEKVRRLFETLRKKLHQAEPQELKKMIKVGVPEYQPYLGA